MNLSSQGMNTDFLMESITANFNKYLILMHLHLIREHISIRQKQTLKQFYCRLNATFIRTDIAIESCKSDCVAFSSSFTFMRIVVCWGGRVAAWSFLQTTFLVGLKFHLSDCYLGSGSSLCPSRTTSLFITKFQGGLLLLDKTNFVL